GEVTPAMAVAVGQSKARQLLMPVNRCNHQVIGCSGLSLNDIISLVIEEVRKFL
ncbi:MAG: DUF3842 family protein, partial [Lachnospiraceae bacterium]|nr:DUF3842 family protein [Lachnospiraceae bacterium]